MNQTMDSYDTLGWYCAIHRSRSRNNLSTGFVNYSKVSNREDGIKQLLVWSSEQYHLSHEKDTIGKWNEGLSKLLRKHGEVHVYGFDDLLYIVAQDRMSFRIDSPPSYPCLSME